MVKKKKNILQISLTQIFFFFNSKFCLIKFLLISVCMFQIISINQLMEMRNSERESERERAREREREKEEAKL